MQNLTSLYYSDESRGWWVVCAASVLTAFLSAGCVRFEPGRFGVISARPYGKAARVLAQGVERMHCPDRPDMATMPKPWMPASPVCIGAGCLSVPHRGLGVLQAGNYGSAPAWRSPASSDFGPAFGLFSQRRVQLPDVAFRLVA